MAFHDTWRSLDRRCFLGTAGRMLAAAGLPLSLGCRSDGVGPSGPRGPSGPGVLFASNWSSGLGTGLAAVTDGGRWNAPSQLPSSSHEVVTVPSVGGVWPSSMVNLLRFSLSTPTTRRLAYNNLSTLQVGEARYWRWYQNDQHVYPVGDNSVHALGMRELGGAAPLELNNVYRSDSRYLFQIQTGTSPLSGPEIHNWTVILDIAVTYRVEIKLERLSPDHYDLDARVYEVAVSESTPLFVKSDFFCFRHGGTHHMGQAVHDNAQPGSNCVIDSSQADLTGKFKITTPGETGTGSLYLGGFCVRSNDWCGPFEGDG